MKENKGSGNFIWGYNHEQNIKTNLIKAYKSSEKIKEINKSIDINNISSIW